jgi:hypothetical protein
MSRTARLDNEGIREEYRVGFLVVAFCLQRLRLALERGGRDSSDSRRDAGATYDVSFAANASTRIPTTMRYTANGTNPCFRTQAINQATDA